MELYNCIQLCSLQKYGTVKFSFLLGLLKEGKIRAKFECRNADESPGGNVVTYFLRERKKRTIVLFCTIVKNVIVTYIWGVKKHVVHETHSRYRAKSDISITNGTSREHAKHCNNLNKSTSFLLKTARLSKIISSVCPSPKCFICFLISKIQNFSFVYFCSTVLYSS